MIGQELSITHFVFGTNGYIIDNYWRIQMLSKTECKTKGVILRIVDFKECDQIFDLYTENGELIGFFARGAHKPKSKYHGVISVGNFVDISYTSGKNLNYPREVNYDLQRIYTFHKKTLEGMYFFSDILLIIRIIAKDYNEPGIYEIFIKAFELAEKNPENFLGIYNHFLKEMLHSLGFDSSPKCFLTGEEIRDKEFYYHPESNHVFSKDHKPRTIDIPLITYDAVFEKNFLRKKFAETVNSRVILKF